MPKSIEFDKKYNEQLYEILLPFIQEWPEFELRQHDAKTLAHLIAMQSHLAQRIKEEGLNNEKNSTNRKKDVTRFIDTLQKARNIWAGMENDDQKTLSSCLEEFKHTATPGHEIIEEITYEQILKIYNNNYPISEWRKEELSTHRNWGLDIEMLDLLISNAELWLKTKAPRAQERHDPILYAVKYMAEVCEQYGIPASHSDQGRFTKIVVMYITWTYPSVKDPKSMYPRDLIKKANEMRRAEPPDFFAPSDDE